MGAADPPGRRGPRRPSTTRSRAATKSAVRSAEDDPCVVLGVRARHGDMEGERLIAVRVIVLNPELDARSEPGERMPPGHARGGGETEGDPVCGPGSVDRRQVEDRPRVRAGVLDVLTGCTRNGVRRAIVASFGRPTERV